VGEVPGRQCPTAGWPRMLGILATRVIVGHVRAHGTALARDCEGYGLTKLTEVPQFVRPFLVPPQVAFFSENDAPVQFGNWMYSLAK
jgi:hypothetical protein